MNDIITNIFLILLLAYLITVLYVSLFQLLNSLLGLPVKPMKAIDFFSEAWAIDYKVIQFVGYFFAGFIGPKTSSQAAQPTQPTVVQASNEIYQYYRFDYENFSCCLWPYLDLIGKRYHLVVPPSASKIYCTHVMDRVRLVNGINIFVYEVAREEPCFSGGLRTVKTSDAKKEIKEIEEILRNNLPAYMTDSYNYTGNIHVWDTGENSIRIEIQGVSRIYGI